MATPPGLKLLKPGDIIQWIQPKDEKGEPRHGVEMLLEVERVDSDQEQVYLNIVERQFTDLSKQAQSRRTVGKKKLPLDEAVKRKKRHDEINKPKKQRLHLTQPDETFQFTVSDEASAEHAAKHWGYVRAVRIDTLKKELRVAKKMKDDRSVVIILTELNRYERLSPQNRGLLRAAMQRDDLARIQSR